jgi:hypothetical protein
MPQGTTSYDCNIHRRNAHIRNTELGFIDLGLCTKILGIIIVLKDTDFAVRGEV